MSGSSSSKGTLPATGEANHPFYPLQLSASLLAQVS
ncbi:hypothetical protein [Streptococcus equi]